MSIKTMTLGVVMCPLFEEYIKTAGTGGEIVNDFVKGDAVAADLVTEVMEAFVVSYHKGDSE